MTLKKRGINYFGDTQNDILEALQLYSQDGYFAEHFQSAFCSCGSNLFSLLVDENEGVAIRVCNSCKNEHPIGDSKEYMEEAELEECECPCGYSVFEITVGVSLYKNSNDVKWVYIGCRCPNCGLTACYADWKNEYENFKEFLKLI